MIEFMIIRNVDIFLSFIVLKNSTLKKYIFPAVYKILIT